MRTREKDRRDSVIILLLILFFGFICIILASGWALRFAPSWKLDTNMGSNLNPNSDFLTKRPVNFIAPLDQAILTQPVWMNVFLTPGISLSTRTPLPTSTVTNIPSKTSTPNPTQTATPAPTNTWVVVAIPTNTKIYYPPPPPIPSNTPITPLPSVDLSITKTDGSPTYTPGNVITYTIVVSNVGSSNAIGASVADAIPPAITGTILNCVANGAASCGTNVSVGNNLSYTGVNISAGAGNFLTITVNGVVAPATTGNLVNTATVTAGAGQADPTPSNNTATDIDTPVFIANLQITKTDNATDYIAGASVQYIIVVSNAGPNGVNGVTVADTFSANLVPASVVWTCTGSGGASCTANGAGNINDAVVNLPAGTSVTYTINATVVASPTTGSLVNTAVVNITASTTPAGITDPDLSNNSATDSDTLIVPDAFPPEIGINPDGTATSGIYNLMSGSYLTLPLNITVNGHTNLDGTPWDLVYYERPFGSGVALDWIIVQVGDGRNWYTVFYWGDNFPNSNPDTNTNMNFNILPLPTTGPAVPPQEPDQRDIPTANLYADAVSGIQTGIAIDLDGVVPPGNYLYVRFFAPPNDTDGHTEIDAVQVLP